MSPHKFLLDHFADASQWRMLKSTDGVSKKVNMQSSSALRFYSATESIAAAKDAAKGVEVTPELVLTRMCGSWAWLGPITKTTEDSPVTKTTAQSLVTKTTAESPVTKTTAESPVTKTTEESPVTKTTTESPVTKERPSHQQKEKNNREKNSEEKRYEPANIQRTPLSRQ